MPAAKQLLSIVFLLLAHTAFAQVDTITNPAYGSAKTLKGYTHIVNFFVSEKGKTWAPEHKQQILDMQNNGIVWLKSQAKQWHVEDLVFRRSNIGFEKDITLDKIEADKEPSQNLRINWVPLVLQAIGYTSEKFFYDSVKTANNADNVVIMIFACHKGRSYAQPAYNDDTNNPRFLEGAVVYLYDYNNNNMYEGTILHEMLHLFGAWDMYLSETRSPEMDKLIKGVFAQSIMLEDHWDIMSDCKIDQLTAWLLGWTNRYRKWFEMFRQSNQQYWKSIPGS